MNWQMGRRVLLLSMRPTPSTGVRWCGTATQTLTSSSRDSSSGVLARAGVLLQQPLPAPVAAMAAAQRRSRKMMMHVRYVRLQRQRRTLLLTGGGGTHDS